MTEPIGWRCSWQDYTGWRTADLVQPRPELQFRDYATKAEAEVMAALQRSLGMTVCVSPTPAPKRTGRRSRFPDPEMPRVSKEQRRLTP